MNEVVKENKDIFIDFNSIAKGYSVDLIGELLSSKKLDNYLIEVGGEILAKGLNKKTQSIWILGIQDPLNQEKYIETVKLSNKSLATSGNYRKYRIDSETGEKYVHTINPITGITSKNNILSVSVLSEDCITSDAWATALLSLDLNKGRAIVGQKESLEALWIISDNDKVEIIKSNNWDKLTN
jgi:thiamine biosynthesis lipoprotein